MTARDPLSAGLPAGDATSLDGARRRAASAHDAAGIPGATALPAAAPRLGVLALQGDFHAHARAFGRLGLPAREVRRVHELAGVGGLVIPGGESTTLLNLMRDEPWFDALRDLHARGGWLFGTCAGAILLSREVRSPAQPSLGLLDAVVERNAYGRQVDSFETQLDVAGLDGAPLRVAFIRAPRFVETGPAVEVLACLDGQPVLLRQGRVLAATFHPEITADDRLHAHFARLVAEHAPAGSALPAA